MGIYNKLNGKGTENTKEKTNNIVQGETVTLKAVDQKGGSMSESLIVTLGLKDAGVNKQITAINKELRFLDKEFKTVNR